MKKDFSKWTIAKFSIFLFIKNYYDCSFCITLITIFPNWNPDSPKVLKKKQKLAKVRHLNKQNYDSFGVENFSKTGVAYFKTWKFRELLLNSDFQKNKKKSSNKKI